MAEVTRSVTAAAPPAAVWALLVDLDRAGEWLPFGTRVVASSGEGLGARFTLELRVRDKPVTVDGQVSKYEEGRAIAFRTISAGGRDVSGEHAGENEYVVEAHGTGSKISVTSRKPDQGGMARRAVARATAQAEGELARRALLRLADLAAGRASLPSESPPGQDVHESSSQSPEGEGRVPPAPPAPPQDTEAIPEMTSVADSLVGPAAREAVETSEGLEEDVVPPAPPMPEVDAAGRRAAPEKSEWGASDAQEDVATSGPVEGVSASELRSVLYGRAQTQQASGVVEPESEAPQPDARLDMSEDEARRLLVDWAASKPLIDKRIFSRSISVANEPRLACTLTRLIETRDEKQVCVPANQALPKFPRYNVGLDAVQVTDPTGFTPASWRLVLEGSERQAPCPGSCVNGREQCPRCQGGTVRCGRCFGSGQTSSTEYVGGRSVQRTQRCPSCAGAGRQPCRNCRGSGWITCAKCQGAGSVIWFVRGDIDHSPTPVEFSQGLPEGVKAKKVPESEWMLLETTPGDQITDLVPTTLRASVSSEIGKRHSNELLRKLEVRGLPVTSVTIAAQPDASVRLVGTSRIVVASGIASSKRIWTTIAIVLLVVAIVLMIALLA